MITYFDKNYKTIDQNLYDSFISNLPIHALTCSCKVSGQLIKHGYYNRGIKNAEVYDEKLKEAKDDLKLLKAPKIRVLRLKCKSCRKTHAVIPKCIVPHSQILLNDHIEIIKTCNRGGAFDTIMSENLWIDESNIQYIIKKYKEIWKEKLISKKISWNASLSLRCFKKFNQQFMQIRSVPNKLNVRTT